MLPPGVLLKSFSAANPAEAAMDETRALLDELMGVERNGDRVKVQKKVTDADVCKNFLAGFCPNEEFERTKHDVGACGLRHDEELRDVYQALDERERRRLGYDATLITWLDKFQMELKAKIRRNEERLAADTAPSLAPEDQTKLQEMADEVQELLTKSEVLGEAGDVDASQAAATQAEALKAARTRFENEATVRAGGNAMNRYGMQEVCPLSGVIVNKEESRVRDHKNGRNYRAWCHLHEVYKKLQAVLSHTGVSPRDKEREREGRKDRDREREKSGHKSRDRERDRDGEKSSRHKGEKREHRDREEREGKHKSRKRSRERDRP